MADRKTRGDLSALARRSLHHAEPSKLFSNHSGDVTRMRTIRAQVVKIETAISQLDVAVATNDMARAKHILAQEYVIE